MIALSIYMKRHLSNALLKRYCFCVIDIDPHIMKCTSNIDIDTVRERLKAFDPRGMRTCMEKRRLSDNNTTGTRDNTIS